MGTITNSLNPKFAVFFLLFIFLFSCSREEIEPDEPFEANLSITSEDIIKDQYIVLLSKKSGRDDPRAEAALEALSKEVGSMNGARVKGKFRHSVTGFVAKLNHKQVEKIRKDKRVISITADRFVDLESTTANNSAVVQEYPTWGLDRMDQRTGLLDRAYAYNSTGAGVNVYIMDSGIKYSHNEFGNRATLGIDLVREYPDEEFDKDDPDLLDGDDCVGHGTHVAGTVGGDNYGMAKGVNLISVRVFSCYGRTTWSRILLAVDWITLNAEKPAVVNMSLGDFYSVEADPVELAINNSIDAGINYVVAGGNSNMEACDFTPARVSKALTVGASDINNQRASFSNYGDCLDLYAPGVSITSAWIGDDTSNQISSGTSMAAPHVTGIVALLLEKKPEATPAEVHTAMLENSTPNFISEVISGPTNIAHSLWQPVEFVAPTPPDLNLKAYGFKEQNTNTIYLSWEPTEDPIIEIFRNGKYLSRWHNSGQYKLQVKGKGGDRFKICEENYVNCSEEVVANFDDTGDFQPNRSPVPDFTYLIEDLRVQFTDTSTDADGTIVNWTWYFGDGNYSTQQHPVHTYNEPGNYRIDLLIEDDHYDLQYIIKYITVGNTNTNKAPTADFSYSSVLLHAQFTDSSVDIDGSIVAWSWDFGDDSTSSEQNPNHLYSEAGSYNVSLTVTDDKGERDSTSKVVQVIAEGSAPGELTLAANGYKVKGAWHADLSWTPTSNLEKVDVYRNGEIIATVENKGSFTDATGLKGGGSLTYKVCEAGTANCSNEVRVQF